jgi:outer membrane murein-binding lipoprotein Lpp
VIVRLFAVVITSLLVAGCANPSKKAAPTTAQIARENTVTSSTFDRLWRACADVARDRQFVIDRQDYRGGVLTTEPLVSAQFFEPWRRDAITADAVAESSLASIRRTIRFTFTREDDGTFSVMPQVIVERYSSAERRITNAMLYRNAFKRTTATGTRESDRGVQLPARYWYRIGNDAALEADLARQVRRRV